MKNIVGSRVREARAYSKPALSQEELAARLESNGWKISRGTLAKIESGIRQVSDYELVALAKALKVPPESLLDIDLFLEYFGNK
jgi:Helix-turn-helix.